MGSVAEAYEKSPSESLRNHEEHRNKDGSLWGPSPRLYSNLRPPTDPQPILEGFYVYVFEPKRVMTQVAPGIVQVAAEARRKRILENESSIPTGNITSGLEKDDRLSDRSRSVPATTFSPPGCVVRISVA